MSIGLKPDLWYHQLPLILMTNLSNWSGVGKFVSAYGRDYSFEINKCPQVLFFVCFPFLRDTANPFRVGPHSRRELVISLMPSS
jgi:hypothetical protein